MDREAYRQMRALQASHWWFRARRDIIATLIGGLRLPPSAQILEAGAGPGGNRAMLATFGDVSAFEMDAEARGIFQEVTGVACHDGYLPDANPFQDAASFDLVVALDVLEHIDDDTGSLRSLATTLRDGGRILLTVPAYQWMFSQHDAFHHHKRRYTLGQLATVADQAGLTLVRGGYFNTLLFPLVALVRLASKLSFGPSKTDMALPAPWINRMLERIFASERHVVSWGGFPFGTSIFAVLRTKTPR